MSAEEYGKRLLAEVEVTGMDKVLHILRGMQDDEHEEELGIPDLDLLLASAQRPQSTATKAKDRAPVIELTSLSPGAGKTHLLYMITALAVLSKLSREDGLHGKQGAVLVIDADDRFDVERLAQIIDSLLSISPMKAASMSHEGHQGVPQEDYEDRERQDAVHRALDHVHIFRPQTLLSLVETVENLETYLYDLPGHVSADRAVRAVILESASAFYWQHRAEDDEAKMRAVERLHGPTVQDSPSLTLYSRLLRALKHAQQCFGCAILYTSQSTPVSQDKHGPTAPPPTRTGSNAAVRPLLPAAWSAYPSSCLLLERSVVPRFALGMSAGDAWTERDMRWTVVKRGEFSAQLLSSGPAANKRFRFYIDADGIQINHVGKRADQSSQP